jgi:hypothetical protein
MPRHNHSSRIMALCSGDSPLPPGAGSVDRASPAETDVATSLGPVSPDRDAVSSRDATRVESRPKRGLSSPGSAFPGSPSCPPPGSEAPSLPAAALPAPDGPVDPEPEPAPEREPEPEPSAVDAAAVLAGSVPPELVPEPTFSPPEERSACSSTVVSVEFPPPSSSAAADPSATGVSAVSPAGSDSVPSSPPPGALTMSPH